MFNEEVFETGQRLLEREVTLEERRFSILAYQEAEFDGSAVATVSPAEETSPTSSIKTARHSGSVLALTACTLLAFSTWHSPLAAQDSANSAQPRPREPLNKHGFRWAVS